MDNSADIIYITTHAKTIMRNLLWPKGPTCPVCGSHHYTKLKDGRYYCKECSKHYSIKQGTIFQKSHLPLSKWLIALYLMLSNNDISSPKLAHYLGISQTTSYYMLLKLRFLFPQDDTILEGDEVACDEEYLFGSWSKMKLSKKQELLDRFMLPKNPKTIREKISIANKANSYYKQPVVAINDGTRVVLQTMTRRFGQSDIVDLFKTHVKAGSHAVTDCSTLYNDWENLTGCPISQNNHSKNQFKTSDGKSSNKTEGIFSQNKRQFLNIHCSMSSKKLQLYLDTFAFNFNTRKLSILERIKIALRNVRQVITGLNLDEYDSLNGKNNDPDIFNPYEWFSQYGNIANEVVVQGVVYRREEFMVR